MIQEIFETRFLVVFGSPGFDQRVDHLQLPDQLQSALVVQHIWSPSGNKEHLGFCWFCDVLFSHWINHHFGMMLNDFYFFSGDWKAHPSLLCQLCLINDGDSVSFCGRCVDHLSQWLWSIGRIRLVFHMGKALIVLRHHLWRHLQPIFGSGETAWWFASAEPRTGLTCRPLPKTIWGGVLTLTSSANVEDIWRYGFGLLVKTWTTETNQIHLHPWLNNGGRCKQHHISTSEGKTVGVATPCQAANRSSKFQCHVRQPKQETPSIVVSGKHQAMVKTRSFLWVGALVSTHYLVEDVCYLSQNMDKFILICFLKIPVYLDHPGPIYTSHAWNSTPTETDCVAPRLGSPHVAFQVDFLVLWLRLRPIHGEGSNFMKSCHGKKMSDEWHEICCHICATSLSFTMLFPVKKTGADVVLPVKKVSLPEDLQNLTFGHAFAQALDGNHLPNRLQMLGRWTQILEKRVELEKSQCGERLFQLALVPLLLFNLASKKNLQHFVLMNHPLSYQTRLGCYFFRWQFLVSPVIC